MREEEKVILLTKLYDIVSRAVEEGVGIGWRRSHKHTDTPHETTVQVSIHNEVMNSLDEVIRWE